jgi:hypothetical protein
LEFGLLKGIVRFYEKIILLLFVIALSPVVKDDICDANTVTTARLVFVL